MSASNCRIVPYNDHDDATLSCSATPLVGFEAENTQNTIRDSVLRTADASAFTFTGVLPSDRVLSHFSMHRHLCHDGSMRLQLFSDAGASVSVYDSGTVSAKTYTATEPYQSSKGSNDPFYYLMSSWLWFTEKTVRSYKVTLSGTPAQAYWSVSRVWLGRYFQLGVNPAYGAQLGLTDQSTRSRTVGGSLRANRGETYRSLTWSLDDVADSEMPTWFDVRMTAVTSADVVVSFFPGDATRLEALYCFAGRFANLDALSLEVSRFTTKCTIEEN